VKNNNTKPSRKPQNGFTLVELVVVILVLGIIAAVAAPKLFDTATNARINSTKQSLVVLRDSIELYKSTNGSYPADKTAIETMLKSPFPTNQISAAANDASLAVVTAGTALSASGVQDWRYDSTTGEIIINTTGYDGF